jgi:small subunit ribosomal protein S2
MPKTSFKELLDAGVHFGHLKRKWNPAMAPYIFMEKSGIHIIDLNKTEIKLNEAAAAMKQIAKSGRKILFVATKKQAKDIVAERVKEIGMPYVTERWPGGMLTNFPTIRKAVKKMSAIDKMATDGTFDTLSKRERLQITRQRLKLEKNLGSIADLTRLPAAMFIVDVHKEYIAVREANRLNIPVFAMVDTNSDPRNIDFPIPSNDDASKSISLIIDFVAEAIAEGLNERKMEKEKEASETKAKQKDSKDEKPVKAAKPRVSKKAEKVEIEEEEEESPKSIVVDVDLEEEEEVVDIKAKDIEVDEEEVVIPVVETGKAKIRKLKEKDDAAE